MLPFASRRRENRFPTPCTPTIPITSNNRTVQISFHRWLLLKDYAHNLVKTLGSNIQVISTLCNMAEKPWAQHRKRLGERAHFCNIPIVFNLIQYLYLTVATHFYKPNFNMLSFLLNPLFCGTHLPRPELSEVRRPSFGYMLGI